MSHPASTLQVDVSTRRTGDDVDYLRVTPDGRSAVHGTVEASPHLLRVIALEDD